MPKIVFYLNIFRQLFLPEQHVALLPSLGYRPLQNQSNAALSWLRWLNESRNLDPQIRHAKNGTYPLNRKYTHHF